MLVSAGAMAIVFLSPWFHWLSALIPLFQPRVTILFMQLSGAYKTDKPAEQNKSS